MITSDFHSIIGGNGGAWLNPAKPVRAGNLVWIAKQPTLLKGSTSGDNAIIGAHAVGAGDTSLHCVAACNPARIVHEDVTWRSDLIRPPASRGRGMAQPHIYRARLFR